MRVIDCARCAETITAPNDDELARALKRHFQSDHGERLDDGEVAEMIEGHAYDAMDS